MEEKKTWKIDVAVLCIFFARPEQFQKTFERVRQARPKVLLLWQDGPRPGRADDVENIMKCRQIAEQIDWDCEVHRNYHEENMGCDPSTFLSHKWAFSIVDKCIILEDDVLVSESFFPFCKELLDKYEHDERIDRICGQTLFGGVPDKRYSYFFGRSGSSIGWATWRRVADTWQPEYDFLDDDYYIDLGRRRFGHRWYEKGLALAKACRGEGKPYWEHIVGFRTTLNSGLVIYPAENMVANTGFGANATHAPSTIKEIPKDIRAIFQTPVCEMPMPLNHPPYIIEDYHYFEKMRKCIAPNKFVRLRRRVEHQMRKLAIKLKLLK